MRGQFLSTLLICLFAANVCFGDDQQERLEFFEKKIRPALVEHCYACHSADAKELGGKLYLDRREAMLEGGESGPVLVPGKADESLLIQALKHDGVEMPPEKPLPEATVNAFIKWVNDGAVAPASKGEVVKPEPLDAETLWSFYPRQNPELPAVKNSAWERDPLDRFVLAKIEANNLTPTMDAQPRVLARRLYYDLIGMPPTVSEVETFVADFEKRGQSAVEHLVDDLLARPQYGERWGRHWLDVARYGESNGNDGLGRNATFPHAWRYRNYVIDAFNQDVPYDRFITEQIAGDLLPHNSAEERNRLLTATGFLAIGSKPAKAMNNNFDMDIVDDQINAVCTGVLGLSVACARCHDHKHDPIPTTDYYALAGIFRSTETLYGLAANEKLTAPPTPLHQLIDRWSKDTDFDPKQPPAFSYEYTKLVKNLQPNIFAQLDQASDKLEEKGKKPAEFSQDQFAKVSESNLFCNLPEESTSYSVSFWFKNDTQNTDRPITAYLFSRAAWGDSKLPGDHLGIGGSHDKSRTGKLFVFNGNIEKVKKSICGETVIQPGTWHHVVFVRQDQRVKLFLDGSDKPEIDAEIPVTFGESTDFNFGMRSDKFSPLAGNLADLAIFARPLANEDALSIFAASGRPTPPKPFGVAMGVRDKKKIENCKVHINGDGGKLGPEIPRGVLTAYERVPESPYQHELKLTGQVSGRLELAKWLTDPQHPQTARVMVNRIWLHLFGAGIVGTPDDFGVYGARPSHPELLDHLANRIVEHKWSIKAMIRDIVLSRTYQLDSQCSPEMAKADPNNTFFARHHRRRLDAEALRDSMLHVSGQLELSPREGSDIEDIDQLLNWPPGESTNLHKPSNRRSVYLCMLRHDPPEDLAAFDLPDGVGVMGQRNNTVLPTQTLFLMNSPFVIEQAEALAGSVLSLPADDDQAAEEIRIRELFRRAYQREPSPFELKQATATLAAMKSEFGIGNDEPLAAWTSLAQALLAANEFRYID